METCLSVLHLNRNDDRSRGADVNAFLVTFSRISSDTMNSYSADCSGLPVMSEVMDAIIIGALLSTVELILPVMLCGTRWNALAKQAGWKRKIISKNKTNFNRDEHTADLCHSFRDVALKNVTLENC